MREAFTRYAEANRLRDYEEAANIWQTMCVAAVSAGATGVLEAMDACEAVSGPSFDEPLAKVAIHRLRLAIEALWEAHTGRPNRP